MSSTSATEITLIVVMVFLVVTPLLIFLVSKLCCNLIIICSSCWDKKPKPQPKRKKSFSSLCTDSKADSGFSEKTVLVDDTESGTSFEYSRASSSRVGVAAATLLAAGYRTRRHSTHSRSSSRSDLSSLGSPVEFDENYTEVEMKEMGADLTESYTPSANHNQGATSSTYCEILQEELSSHDIVPAAQPIEWQSYGLSNHGPAFTSSDTNNQSESLHELDTHSADHFIVEFNDAGMSGASHEPEVTEFNGSNSDNTAYEE